MRKAVEVPNSPPAENPWRSREIKMISPAHAPTVRAVGAKAMMPVPKGHQQDRHGQRLLASRFVAVAAKHHGAERTDHVGQRERPESQKQSRDAVPGREEKLADDQGE